MKLQNNRSYRSLLVEMQNGVVGLEAVSRIFQNTKYSYNPDIKFLSIYLKKLKMYVYTKTYT